MSEVRRVQAQGASGASLYIGIPASIVRNMNIKEGDYLWISVDESKMIMEKMGDK